MAKAFDPSRVDEITAKVKAGDSTTATYAMSKLKPLIESVRQTEIARKPRLNELNALIAAIVKDDPEITEKGLWRELEKRAGQGVIVEMTADDKIQWKTSAGKVETTPISALKDRLSRVKQRLKV